jgi:outer membrane protein assembly factor BamB
MLRLLTLLSGIALSAACGGGTTAFNPGPWNQLHSVKENTGFNAVHTVPAQENSKKWVAPVGRLGFSAPAVGPDGTVYVGNVTGEAVAVYPNGQVRWRRQLGSSIVATPAVHMETGETFYVVQNPLTPDEYGSFIYRLSPAGQILAVSTEPLTTTGAPKIWREYIFLASAIRVYVFNRASLQAIAQANANPCWGLICIDSGIFDWFWGMVDIIGCLLHVHECITVPDYGPLHEPSVAVVDNVKAAEDPEKPIVVVTTGRCITAWRFSRFEVVDQRLQPLWQHNLTPVDCDSDPLRVTSPAVVAGNQAVFGDEKGRVRSFDVKTGTKLWEQDVEFGIRSAPVGFLRQIYLVMQHKLVVLDSDGAPLSEVAIRGLGQAAALSLDYLYVTTYDGIYTFNLDPPTGSTFDAAPASTPTQMSVPGLAIAPDGTIYVTDPDGYLHAYGPMQ